LFLLLLGFLLLCLVRVLGSAGFGCGSSGSVCSPSFSHRRMSSRWSFEALDQTWSFRFGSHARQIVRRSSSPSAALNSSYSFRHSVGQSPSFVNRRLRWVGWLGCEAWSAVLEFASSISSAGRLPRCDCRSVAMCSVAVSVAVVGAVGASSIARGGACGCAGSCGPRCASLSRRAISTHMAHSGDAISHSVGYGPVDVAPRGLGALMGPGLPILRMWRSSAGGRCMLPGTVAALWGVGSPPSSPGHARSTRAHRST